SALKQHEEELARQSALLQASLDSISQGLSAYDADLRLIALNRKFVDMLGLPPELARIGTSFEAILRHAARRGVYGPVEVDEFVADRLARNRSPRPYCFEGVQPNGTVLEIRRHPMAGGGMVATYTHITDRRRQEEEQARQAALLQAMFDNMTQGVAVYDRDFALAAFNKRYVTLLDFPEELIKIGLRFEDLMRHNAVRGDYGPGDVEAIVAK